jgi:pyruvate dehydrogenase E2 component (dihydrolipoamide acetyltransferase)
MTAAASVIEVRVPDIGDFADVPVIEIHVAPGDAVALDDPLLTLESDKATMDVPAPAAGIVEQVLVKLDDRVSEGTAVITLRGESSAEGSTAEEPPEAVAPASDAPSSDAPSPDAPAIPAGGAPTPAASVSPAPTPTTSATPDSGASNGGGPIYASPSIRRLARERGVDLRGLTGTGRKGRITKDDVEGATAGGTPAAAPSAGAAIAGLDLAPWPTVDFEKFGPVERVQRTRIQRISAPNLARNWVMIPHVTQNDEADITDLEAWRKQLNAEQSDAKVTMVAFLVAASVATLKEFPIFNSSLDGDELVLKRYYNIGFAADTPGGLVVPVIKNADQKGLFEIARELTELSGRAREGKLAPGDMSGGTFTISSLGGIGGTSFTPIINAPEVAILGVSRSAMKPVWNGSEFVPRLMVPLSLSYDHRVIDGAAAARFVVALVGVLSDLRRALL